MEARSNPSVPILIEYWDSRFVQYSDADHDYLFRGLQMQPRPSELHLGHYKICKFDEIELGTAFQENTRTKFKRPMRLKPPYRIRGDNVCTSLEGKVFGVILDHGPVTFSKEIQNELRKYASCAPVPKLVHFAVGSHLYALHDIDKLVSGHGQASQLNLRTGKKRLVFLESAKDAQPKEDAQSKIASWLQNTLASISQVSIGQQKNEPASFLDAGKFYYALNKEFAAQDAERIIAAWRQDPRPEQVNLTANKFIVGFRGFEKGLALLKGMPGSSAMGSSSVRVELPVQNRPHSIVLPRDLDMPSAATTWPIASAQDLADLRAREENSLCLICQEEMVAQTPGPGGNLEDNPDNAVVILKCGHYFHRSCIGEWFEQKLACPTCLAPMGKLVGKQPKVAEMSWAIKHGTLRGHAEQDHIRVSFKFPSGQDPSGEPYEGREPQAYLPNNAQGIMLLELFKVAFRRCLMFTLGTSLSLRRYRVVYNIHLKSTTHGGAAKHGYPDDDYFDRALQELQENGVSIADL